MTTIAQEVEKLCKLDSDNRAADGDGLTNLGKIVQLIEASGNASKELLDRALKAAVSADSEYVTNKKTINKLLALGAQVTHDVRAAATPAKQKLLSKPVASPAATTDETDQQRGSSSTAAPPPATSRPPPSPQQTHQPLSAPAQAVAGSAGTDAGKAAATPRCGACESCRRADVMLGRGRRPACEQSGHGGPSKRKKPAVVNNDNEADANGDAEASDFKPYVSIYTKTDSLENAKKLCKERSSEATGILMGAVWDNLRDLMRSEHRDAMQSREENTGRDHWCDRFTRSTAEYKDVEVKALRSQSLLPYDVFVSREHGYAPKKRGNWPSPGAKRADACIWLRKRSLPRLGPEPPVSLKSRTELDNELRAGGMQCALVLEFKYARTQACSRSL